MSLDIDEKYPGDPALIMTLREWINYVFNPMEIIFNASPVDGSDSAQQVPIGVSAYLAGAFTYDPRDMHTKIMTSYTLRNVQKYVNAIFSVETTQNVGNQREALAYYLQHKQHAHIHVRLGTVDDRLNPHSMLSWYCRTAFTLSPRGNGTDCHRNYEAMLCKSVPIIYYHDEVVRNKYRHLPVVFATKPADMAYQNLKERYKEMLNTEYNFNYLTRSYWKERRPDLDINYQSLYWLKTLGGLKYVERYFTAAELSAIDS